MSVKFNAICHRIEADTLSDLFCQIMKWYEVNQSKDIWNIIINEPECDGDECHWVGCIYVVQWR